MALNKLSVAARLGTALIGIAAFQPAAVMAQASSMGNPLPSSDISLAQLKAEAGNNAALDLGKTLRGGLQQVVEQDLNSLQHYREVYSLKLRSRQAIQIDLSSKEIDTLLRVYDENGALVAENDDWGGNTNSRLFLSAFGKVRDRFFLVATAAQPRKGDFELVFRERPAPSGVQVRPIAVGQTVSGELTPTSPLSVESQVVYDSYSFEGTEGDVVKLVATPTDAPVLLELKHGQDAPFRAGTTLPGRPVTIYGTLKGTGRYDVTVSGSPSATAPYKLEFTKLGPAVVESVPITVTVGQEINNQFTPASPVFAGTDRPFILYRFNGRAGEAIAAVVEGADAPVQQRGYSPISVDIGVDSPVGFATVQSPTRISRSSSSVRFERDGFVFIRVMGPPGATTPYKLRINQVEAVQPALKAE